MLIHILVLRLNKYGKTDKVQWKNVRTTEKRTKRNLHKTYIMLIKIDGKKTKAKTMKMTTTAATTYTTLRTSAKAMEMKMTKTRTLQRFCRKQVLFAAYKHQYSVWVIVVFYLFFFLGQ